MKRFRSILGIFAVFALGAIAGGMIMFLVLRSIVTAPRRAYVQGGSEGVATLVARQFERRLHTDRAQDEEVRKILHEATQELEIVGDRVLPEVKATVEKAESRLRAVLTPKQQLEFDKMMERARATWKKVQPRAAKEP